ncbi:MAG: PAS domain S-box protein [Euryarchaeota archaeon]|nr:MAG: Methanogenesis regulatory protein FilR1 [ANME-2 cluster archaeon]MEA1864678.1 PAS domain S-box protein [Euryarchaeota archaeon]
MADIPIKVLLIEDNPGDARLIEVMLSLVSGTLFDVENANRLSDGLKHLSEGKIDAVLLDLGLPDSSGLDTFEKVNDQAPEVPIVMLTGLDDTELALEGMRMGAQDYLVKGRVDGDLLARTLRYAIERKSAEEHIEHLNSVLKAIRNVNQLIVTETERDSLLRKSCDALVDARGYDAVWLGFLRECETFDMVVGSGFREDITHFSDRVAGGDHPPCIKDALSQKEQVTVIDRTDLCGDCVFRDACLGRAAAIIRVEHADRFFGLLAVSFAPDVAVDDEEKGLLAEVASDIGIALHHSEITEARKIAEDALLESEGKYRSLIDDVLDTSDVGIFILDNEFKVVWINHSTEKYFNLKREDVIGKDKRQLIRNGIKDIFEDPITFKQKVFAMYNNNIHIGNFECHVLPGEGRKEYWLEHWSQPIRSGLYKGGRIEHYSDITEQKASEEMLRMAGERFKTIVETAPSILMISDAEGSNTYISPNCEEFTGHDPDELTGGIMQWVHEDDAERAKGIFERTFHKGVGCKDFEYMAVKKNGDVWYASSSWEPLIDAKGEFKGAVFQTIDITERKAAEESIKDSESRYKHLYSMVRLMCDNLPDLIWTKDLKSNFIFVNTACCDILLNARDTDEPIGKDDIYFARRERETHPENPGYHTFGETCLDSDSTVMETKKPQRFEESGNVRGEFIYLDVYKAPFWDEEYTMLGTVGCARVVTKEKEMEEARRKTEEEIERSLMEKETLLREIHHRVKNNLQVVSSLLSMQARTVKDKDTIEMLSEARNRINAMSLIHSQLYESSNLSNINIKKFVGGLLSQLLQTHPVQDTKIILGIRVADRPFPISLAVPIGLVINELLTNILKHAFDDISEGTIEVALDASEDGRINLRISDDGVGLPGDFNIDSTGTIGLRLVKILVEEQLRGDMSITSDGVGTIFGMSFVVEGESSW